MIINILRLVLNCPADAGWSLRSWCLYYIILAVATSRSNSFRQWFIGSLPFDQIAVSLFRFGIFTNCVCASPILILRVVFFLMFAAVLQGGTLLRVGEQLNNRVLGRAGHLWKLAREMFLNWVDVSLERGCCTEAALANTGWSTAVVRLFFCVDVNLYVAFR